VLWHSLASDRKVKTNIVPREEEGQATKTNKTAVKNNDDNDNNGQKAGRQEVLHHCILTKLR
jgi:hypothetical protein